MDRTPEKVKGSAYDPVVSLISDLAIVVGLTAFGSYVMYSPDAIAFGFQNLAAAACIYVAGSMVVVSVVRFRGALTRSGDLKSNRKWVLALSAAAAIAAGLTAATAISVARSGRLASICERAESNDVVAHKNHPKCSAYYKKRALADDAVLRGR